MFIRNKGHINLVPMPGHAWEVLKEGVGKLQMKYWLTTGTLLGLYRDKELIPHDTDIDIAVKGDETVWADLIIRLVGFEVIRIVINNGKVQQVAFKRRDVIFDVFVYWYAGDDVWRNDGASGRLVLKKDDFRQLETKYGTFSVPTDTEEYLKMLYGNWKVPSRDKPRYQ